jgi:PAS domain S-box-containing protein
MTTGEGRSIRVLCVDDEPGFASLTADVLETRYEDISAVGVQSVEAALERLAESTFDCVVSDYDMPDADGLELLDDVRGRYPSKPFILFTGRGSEAIASEAVSSGVSDYLQKTGGQEQYELLANRIRTCVARLRERRSRERAEDWYSQLFEQRLIGAGLSQGRTFELVNRRLAEILGTPRDELEGTPVSSVIAPHDRDRVERAIRRRESGDDDRVRYTVDLLTADGSTVRSTVVGSRVTYEGEPAILGLIRPTREVDAPPSRELRDHVEAAVEALSRDGGGADPAAVETAKTHLEGALTALDATGAGAPPAGPGGSARLADAVREAVSQAGLSTEASVTVSPDGVIDRDHAAVVLTVRSLLEAALETEADAVDITAQTTAEGFRVTVRDSAPESGEAACVTEMPLDVGVDGDATYGIDLFMRRVTNGIRCDAVVADR